MFCEFFLLRFFQASSVDTQLQPIFLLSHFIALSPSALLFVTCNLLACLFAQSTVYLLHALRCLFLFAKAKRKKCLVL